MDRTAALALTSRIEATWTTHRWPSSRTTEWTNALETLDEGAAGTAFTKLRSNGKPDITITEFIAKTKSLTTHDASTRREPCTTCTDSGWTPAPDRTWPDGHTSSQWKPCTCPEGHARASSRIWTERNHHQHQTTT